MGNEEKKIPRHVAIIMDGNGRWAKKRFLPRIKGHSEGSKSLRTIIETAARAGVRYLTVFAFSTENWKRPESEVSALMEMLESNLKRNADELIANNIRMRFMGERSRLSPSLIAAMEEVEEKSRHCTQMDFIVALSYGARQEIVDTVKKIAQQVKAGTLEPEEIDESLFAKNMYLPDVPDPDLLIRTSGECRISNFLLWQIAYSEIIVHDVFWPDFREKEFMDCLAQYAKRDRRYGLTQEQIVSS